MKWAAIRNLLAAIGAFFLAIIVLSIIISILSRDSNLPFGEKVAIIDIEGIISDSADLTDEIRHYAERDDVKAVVLRINSPGGAVGPAQEIYREVKRLRRTKRVVASMGGVAASGGYYIAAAADKIVANPGTITGSIGVIIEFINVEDLFRKLGLKGYVVKSGRFKDVGSPLREMSQEDVRLLQDVIDDVHRQFVDAVAQGRGLKREQVERIADGRIFSGAQAVEHGLVDVLGNQQDAIDLVARLAGIEGRPSVIHPKKPKGLLSILLGENTTRSIGELVFGARIMYLLPDFVR